MDQVEQWFSILQRKRFRATNFVDLADLEAKVLAFIDEWNATAHPFSWTAASFDKMLRRDKAGGHASATGATTSWPPNGHRGVGFVDRFRSVSSARGSSSEGRDPTGV